MRYRALICSSLLSIGLDPDRVHQIEAGAEIYGEEGLLDSVHLVSLIVTIEEALERVFGCAVNFFSEGNLNLLDAFRSTETLASFIERNLPKRRPEPSENGKSDI